MNSDRRTVPNEWATSVSSRWGRIWAIAGETIHNWEQDNVSRLAAALSCYALLSIAPLGIMSVAVAGLVFGQEAARGHIAAEIGSIVGSEAARAIELIVANSARNSGGILGAVLGIVVLILGASGVFVELQSAMNTIWKVAPKPGQGVITFIRHRMLSFAMVLAVAFLLLVSLIVNAALSAIGKFFGEYLPVGEVIWQVAYGAVSFVITAGLFALIFKVLPDIEVAWGDVWPGAFVTAFLFTIGKVLLALYIGESSVTSSFGAAGSLVALVIWVYYSSQIVFLGAELAEVYSRRVGTGFHPTEHAVSVQRS